MELLLIEYIVVRAAGFTNYLTSQLLKLSDWLAIRRNT